MADTVPSPQQPASGSQNVAPVVVSEQDKTAAAQPAPSIQEQATQQSQQAMQQAGQAVTQVQQTGQQITQGAQQVMGQAGQVSNQASQLFSQAAQIITSKPTQPQPPVKQDEKLWAALSYIPMVALIAFLIKPKSEFVKLHGRQGLLIFVIFFFSIFLYIILPPLGPILGGLIQFAMFVIGIFSIYQAFMGNWWKTPILGNVADMIPVDVFTNVTTQAITGQEPSQNSPMEEVAPMEQGTAADTTTQNSPAPQQNPPAAPPVPPTPPVQQ